ncbi:hypothetical protein F0562_017467 [Nyssa sinensis]|uniref:BTB domain-containing protein n=1 Tax=Nyssa sinensis TaxID=561372 RepID=A0A5J4ZH45_9ASTE|nr:hypothetical protein F0562_017467 [Nyssa sinensis]
MEFKIIGLSEKPCNQQFFPLKVKGSDGAHDGGQTTEITVSDPIQIPESMNLQLGKSSSSQEAFELCAKFCYGITITLCAFNIVSTRCAAEYLQMTEDVEKGNLIYKIEVFFNSCILHG